jgi:UDP-N-acetylmuramoyl-tripeptide--D-alanyl-D-alanine ligase
MILEGALFVLTRDWVVLLVLLILRFFILTSVVYLFSFPTWALKRYYIAKAAKKMLRYPNMVVVGITGSYGKSSVKEFLAHFLSTTLRVEKTPKNINTEMGVARFILNTDFLNTDVFVVEMGAYRPGEIKLICDMVRPKIGILTVIAEQHLSLFGSIKNIQAAKYELLRSLPKDGFAVTNADNPYCTEFLDTLVVKEVETFGTEPDNAPDCLITDVETHDDGIICSGTYHGKTGGIVAPVIGAHHVYNIAAASMVAVYLGVADNDIVEAAKTLPIDIQGSLKKYMYGKATILDDSYNSNPEGFKAALDVLKSVSHGKKTVVITRGMLELGGRSKELHEQIGGEVAFVADELVVISKDFFESLRRGAGSKYRTNVVLKENHDELVQYLRKLKEESVYVLLENRMPSAVIQELSQYSPK